MPYQGEFANPDGTGSLLESPLIRGRLETFKATSSGQHAHIFQELKTVRPEDLPPSPRTGAQVNHIYAVDGSVILLEDPREAWELALFKVGVVHQSLKHYRKVSQEEFVTRQALDGCFRTGTVEGIISGRGFTDRGHDDLTPLDKFRQEVYEVFRQMPVAPAGLVKAAPEVSTLLEVLRELRHGEEVTVRCPNPSCGSSSPVPYPQGACETCEEPLYYTDFLELYKDFNPYSSNQRCYNAVMSTCERVLMSGLLMKAARAGEERGEDLLGSIAYFTDGPLALFEAKPLVNSLLEQVQSLPQPLLAGFEKTGALATFALSPQVQERLPAGTVTMVGRRAFQAITGKTRATFGESVYYGRHFIYRTRRGDKTFVFAVPASRGNFYGYEKEGKEQEDTWENYPTLSAIISLIEETQVDVYSLTNAVLTPIARANDTASIPAHLGEELLRPFVETIISS